MYTLDTMQKATTLCKQVANMFTDTSHSDVTAAADIVTMLCALNCDNLQGSLAVL